jgi:hypothetical protein
VRVAVKYPAVQSGTIQIGGDTRQSQRRHDVRLARDIIFGSINLIAKGMNKQKMSIV